jgi:hypothetical protein
MIQKKRNEIVLMALMVALVSLLIGPVSAVDYDFWHSHMPRASDRVLISGVHPWGTTDVYSDGLLNLPSIYDQAVAQHMPSGGGVYDTFKLTMAGTSTGYVFNKNTPILISGSTVSDTTGGHSFSLGDGDIFQIRVVNGSLGYQLVGPQYVYHASTTPIISDFIYSPDQPWIDPAIIQFTDTSTGPLEDERYWEIGEVGYGTLRTWYSPGSDVFRTIEMTFPYSGNFYVNLTVTNSSISDTKTEYYTVYNPADTYTLSITPSTINIGENTTAVILSPTGDFSIMNNYILYCALKDSMVSGVEVKSDGNEPVYHFDGDIWQQVDDLTHLFTVPYGAEFPESITLSGWDAPGDYECEATLFTSDNTPVPRMYADVTVSGEVDQYQTVVINVRDSDASFIYGATASLKRADGTWDNKTVSSGPVSFLVKDMEWIGYTATSDGYEDPGVLYTQISQGKNIDIVLSKPLPAADPGFANLQIYVKASSDGAWVALAGTSVVMSDGQTKITPESGLATFTMTANSTYSVTASKTGYNSLTIPITCGASTCGGYTIVMTSTSANPSVTATETAVPDGVTTYPPGVPMPGTSTTYPPGVPVQGAATGNATARDVAQDTLNTWMIWGGTFFLVIFGIMLLGFSGDAIKKWSWLWK